MTVTVLVVDDDAAFRHLATRRLRSWGYQVVGEAGFLAKDQRAETALPRLLEAG